MERRFTAFLLPLLLLGLFFVFFSNPGQKKPPAPPPAQGGQQPRPAPLPPALESDVWQKDFGEPGGVGFRVTFDNRGALVREVRLLDHYVSLEARDRETHRSEDYYAIVESPQPGYLSLALEELGGNFARRFEKVKLDGDLNEHGGYERWTPTVGDDEVRFSLDTKDGRTLEKVFRYEGGRRDLTLELNFRAEGSLDAGEVYPLRLRGVTLPNPRSERVLGGNPALAIGGTFDGETSTHDAVRDPDPAQWATVVAARGAARFYWGGATNRFFGGFLYPDNEEARAAVEHMKVEARPLREQPDQDLAAFSVPVPQYYLNLKVPEAGQTTSLKLRLFLGPKSYSTFAEQPDYERFLPVMDEDLTPVSCICTIPGVTTMAQVLLQLLEFLHGLVGNWGVAIILLTILVKIAVFFLNFRTQKTMRAYGAKMARVKPELDALQAKFKDKPKELQREMMAFYRKHKVFPPLGGCLPLLLTIPVFFGLFTALRVSYDLRQQPFVAWIDDLSKPDALFDLGLPLVPHFNLLPVVWMVLYSIMMFRMKLPADPQQRMVQQMMRWMFLAFGVILYNYASGLLLYMTTSMALAFFEQWLIKRILGPMPDVAGVSTMPTL